MQIPWSNLTWYGTYWVIFYELVQGDLFSPNCCSVKERKIIQWRKEPCECWVRRRFGWSWKTFIFMSLFLTVSESLCSELLMKKGMELGVYKDECGLVSDQSEACDEEWGQDRVWTRGPLNAGGRWPQPVRRIPNNWEASFHGAIRDSRLVGDLCMRDRREQRPTDTTGVQPWIWRVLDTSSIWKFFPTEFGVCTGRKEGRNVLLSLLSSLPLNFENNLRNQCGVEFWAHGL